MKGLVESLVGGFAGGDGDGGGGGGGGRDCRVVLVLVATVVLVMDPVDPRLDCCHD